MNVGARMLRETGVKQVLIAKALGVSRQAVSMWCNGTDKPGQIVRAKIKKIYGVPVDAWDKLMTPSVIANEPMVPVSPVPVAPAASSEASSPVACPAVEETTEAMLRAQVDRSKAIASDASLDPETRLRAEARLTHALRALAAYRGEADVMSEAKIVRHPAFKRMMIVLVKALEPWPEAMRAAGLALRAYDQSGGAEVEESTDAD